MKKSISFFPGLLIAVLLSTTLFAQDGDARVQKVLGPQKGRAITGGVKNIIYPPLATGDKTKGKVPATTVYDDLQAVSRPQREEIAVIVQEEMTNPNNVGSDWQYWNTFGMILDRCDGGARIGRTYGDPHISTFDGHRYDLQSVGEFVLCRSLDGNFEVQTRQSATSDKVSMNTACAINMVGDVVSVEAAPVHTLFNPIIRVNGEEVDFEHRYATPKGVLLTKAGSKISVHSPIGEKVLITPISNGKYLSVVPTIVKGGDVEYEGLLGDADGSASNDLRVNGDIIPARPSFYTMEELANGGNISNSTAKAEKSNQATIAHDFGHYWRITNETSLFTYARGRDTDWYTDLSYPREFATISDHKEADVRKAQEHCKNAGVGADDMQGCMTDVLLTGDPKAAEYSTELTTEKVVKDLKINNDVLASKPLEAKPESIKASKKEINKQDAKLARANAMKEIEEMFRTPSQSTSKPTTTSTSSKPVYKPASKPVYKPASQPAVRTQTRTVTRTSTTTAKPRSTSGTKTTKTTNKR